MKKTKNKLKIQYDKLDTFLKDLPNFIDKKKIEELDINIEFFQKEKNECDKAVSHVENKNMDRLETKKNYGKTIYWYICEKDTPTGKLFKCGIGRDVKKRIKCHNKTLSYRDIRFIEIPDMTFKIDDKIDAEKLERLILEYIKSYEGVSQPEMNEWFKIPNELQDEILTNIKNIQNYYVKYMERIYDNQHKTGFKLQRLIEEKDNIIQHYEYYINNALYYIFNGDTQNYIKKNKLLKKYKIY